MRSLLRTLTCHPPIPRPDPSVSSEHEDHLRFGNQVHPVGADPARPRLTSLREPPLNILFLSQNFPPEVNAPATRLAEHARAWTEDGHNVEILTSVPNFPEGEVYEGYQNRLTIEDHEGARVVRVPMYAAPNRGTVRRTLSYLSFMRSAVRHRRSVRMRPDVVVATSPQFFCALAGYRVARAFGVPFVFEVRDLWPDSIVAVGAARDSLVIRLLRRLEGLLYDRADHIVVVTEAFVDELAGKGVPREKISVVENGIDRASMPALSSAERESIREELGVGDRFLVSYVGTLGMAHGAEVLIEAARRAAASEDSADRRLAFLLIGEGSERPALEAEVRAAGLENLILNEKLPRDRALRVLAASDVSLVHLKDRPVFRTVLPSKMFEAMALGVPIALGVDGEARRILETSGAGAFFPPEDSEALLRLVRSFRDDPTRYGAMAQAGPGFVADRFDRRALARKYAQILERVV